MRIGIDVRMSGYSGIGTYINGLIKGLSKIDTKNEYILVTNEDNILSLPSNFEFKRIRSKVFSLRSQFEILSIVKKEKLDLLHIPYFYSIFFCPCRMVVTIHDLILSLFPEELSLPKRLYYNLMISHSLKKAEGIITVSRNTKRDIINLFHIPEEKIRVIYEGVDEDFRPVKDGNLLDEVKNKYHIDAPFIFYAGLRKPHKNLVRLIDAFKILKESGKREKLVIAGKKDLRYPLEQEIKKRNLEREIILTGYVPKEDLVLLYNAADIFILPSLYEGFGLPALEAMACGKPVIASNCSSMPEITGNAAILVDPYNVEGMSRTIKSVLDNEQLRNTLSEKALERSKTFSWLKCATETLDVYESLANQ